jgi:hypothetical protein
MTIPVSEEVLNVVAPVLAGFLFAFLGLLCLVRELKLWRQCTAQTEGIISRIESRKKNGKHHSHPVIDYTVSGMAYSTWGAERFLIKTGREVTVLYNPDDPNICMVKQDKFRRVLGFPIIIGMGILGIVLGIASMFIE